MSNALSVITDVVNWGALAFLVGAFLQRWAVPGWTYEEKAKDAVAWKGLYENERGAHAATREAYAIQGERLQVAVESGRVTEALLREARGRAVSPAQEQP